MPLDEIESVFFLQALQRRFLNPETSQPLIRVPILGSHPPFASLYPPSNPINTDLVFSILGAFLTLLHPALVKWFLDFEVVEGQDRRVPPC